MSIVPGWDKKTISCVLYVPFIRIYFPKLLVTSLCSGSVLYLTEYFHQTNYPLVEWTKNVKVNYMNLMNMKNK